MYKLKFERGAMVAGFPVDRYSTYNGIYTYKDFNRDWTIFSSKSATGAHILPSTWDFKFKRFPDGRLWKFKIHMMCQG